MIKRIGLGIVFLLLLAHTATTAQDGAADQIHQQISEQTDEIYDQVVEWRRHFHENPELSNREEETAEYIAEYLRSLGLEVETGIAHTGVVGILEGGQEGPLWDCVQTLMRCLSQNGLTCRLNPLKQRPTSEKKRA